MSKGKIKRKEWKLCLNCTLFLSCSFIINRKRVLFIFLISIRSLFSMFRLIYACKYINSNSSSSSNGNKRGGSIHVILEIMQFELFLLLFIPFYFYDVVSIFFFLLFLITFSLSLIRRFAMFLQLLWSQLI